jgi:hypothetical protein
MTRFHILFCNVLAYLWTVLSYWISYLLAVPIAGLMFLPVRKMCNYFPETHHSTVSCDNQSDLITGAL